MILADTDIDDNGRGIGPELGCTACHEVTRPRFGIAYPFRFYIAALTCGECGEQLAVFEI